MHTKSDPKRFAAVLVASVLWLAAAIPASAADSLIPSSVVKTMVAGSTATQGKTLNLDGLPARADIIIAVDTTGSMGVAISQAQTDANNICTQVQGAIPGARFSVVDFEDYPPPAGPGAVGDIPYRLLTTGFTSTCADLSTALLTMTAVPGSGGDEPEAYNRALFEAYSEAAYNLPVIAGGRDPLASQFIVVLGDAFPHSDTAFNSCPARPPADLGRDGVSGTSDDLNTSDAINGLINNDITLLMIRYNAGTGGGSLTCYQDMAGATGGTAVDDTGVGQIGPFIINNAAAVPYTVALEVTPSTCPIGLSFNLAPGPYTGPQVLSFTESITAPTAVGTYTCTVTAVTDPGGPTTAVETVTVNVVPGDPAKLTLSPKTATNTVDAQHCVTATVVDAFDNPTPGIIVDFSVSPTTFRTPPAGSSPTNASGQATFCYTSALPGDDVITATAHGGTNPSDTARKTWVLPGSTAGCKVNNGGRITAANGDKATFGGMAKGTGPSGSEEYQDHGAAADINVHSINILAVRCSPDGINASIFGKATINGAGSFDYRIDVKDLGEPGTSDTYRIRLSNGYDSGEQVLSGGNVQTH